ncbi:cell surface glycoprotein (s-layer protein)-like protein [Anaeramoeba flamelloides]|uniref:Cell surface glycoprotein (S-layer protein)-like protein n=1 Tax=Anaeramoeba flamelloides TaxID=1746091 RepID=A0AAV7YBX2_9EUKA|nr:cell surface glycoprotein (s-layer protein)-like protein [Anaeramoeba flamelloides]
MMANANKIKLTLLFILFFIICNYQYLSLDSKVTIYSPFQAQQIEQKSQKPINKIKDQILQQNRDLILPSIIIKNGDPTNACVYEMRAHSQNLGVCFQQDSIHFSIAREEKTIYVKLAILNGNLTKIIAYKELQETDNHDLHKNRGDPTTPASNGSGCSGDECEGDSSVFKSTKIKYYSNQNVKLQQSKQDFLKSDSYNYQKILYKDIYPNIDLEFVIVNNVLKSSFILSQAKDLKKIQTKYTITTRNTFKNKREQEVENFEIKTGPNGELFFIDNNHNNPIKKNSDSTFTGNEKGNAKDQIEQETELNKIFFYQDSIILQQGSKFFYGKTNVLPRVNQNQKHEDKHNSWLVNYSIAPQEIALIEPNEILIVDPYYFTYLGSTNNDISADSVLNPTGAGSVIVTGKTDLINWKMAQDNQQTRQNYYPSDLDEYTNDKTNELLYTFIANVSLDGKSLYWINYYRYLVNEYQTLFEITSIDLDENFENILVSGYANNDLSVFSDGASFITDCPIDFNCLFVAKISSDGSEFVWFTYLNEGWNYIENGFPASRINDLKVQPNGDILLAGFTDKPIPPIGYENSCSWNNQTETSFILSVLNDGSHVSNSMCYYEESNFENILYEMTAIPKNEYLIAAAGYIKNETSNFYSCLILILNPQTFEIVNFLQYSSDIEDGGSIACKTIDYNHNSERLYIGAVSNYFSLSDLLNGVVIMIYDLDLYDIFSSFPFPTGEVEFLTSLRYLGLDSNQETIVICGESYLWKPSGPSVYGNDNFEINQGHWIGDQGSVIEFKLVCLGEGDYWDCDFFELFETYIYYTGKPTKILPYGNNNQYLIVGDYYSQISPKWNQVLEQDHQGNTDIFIHNAVCIPGYEVIQKTNTETGININYKECQICEKGYTGDGISGTCAKCTKGTYSSAVARADLECTYCPLGYYGTGEGKTSLERGCEPCGLGEFCNSTGQMEAEKCFYENTCIGFNKCLADFNTNTEFPCTNCNTNYMFQKGECFKCYQSGIWIGVIIVLNENEKMGNENENENENEKKTIKNNEKISIFFWNYFSLLLKYLFIPVLALSLSPYSKHENGNDSDGNIEYRLEDDFSIIWKGEQWKKYEPLFIISLIIFVCGIPLFFFVLIVLTKYTKSYYFWQKRIPWLFERYLLNRIWTELIEIISKIIITSVVVLQPRNAKLQAWVVFATLLLNIVLLLLLRPYKISYVDYYKKYNILPPKYSAETRIAAGSYILLVSFLSLGLENLGFLTFLLIWSLGTTISVFGIKNNLDLLLIKQLEENNTQYERHTLWKKHTFKNALKKTKTKSHENNLSGSTSSSSGSSSGSGSSSNNANISVLESKLQKNKNSIELNDFENEKK